MIINRNWEWVGLFGFGAFAVGFSLAVIALVHLWSAKLYDKFDDAARNQLYITAIVYISFVFALFMVALLVWIATRNPHGNVAHYMKNKPAMSRSGNAAIY